VIAANVPDLDLLYTWITPAPIGYLVHHRGHTHTVVGIAALGAALALISLALPSVRGAPPALRRRLSLVIGAGVLSHLLLDAGNSYGVHPFYPVDMRWYYGDSLFIFEPLLWLLLGGAVAMNGRSRLAGRLLFGALALLSIATAAVGIVPWLALAALTAIAGGAGWWARRSIAPRRAILAIAGVIVFSAAMFGVSRAARAEAMRRLPAPAGAERLDVVLTPSPAFPLCWAVITIDMDEAAGVLRMRRGSISLAPALWSAADCPLQRLAATNAGPTAGALSLSEDIEVPLGRLRAVALADCRVGAWLRFVRAPVIAGRRAYDLRFERAGGGNFTGMEIGGSSDACPDFVPAWTMPRADALR
jgi:inner membrane protein